MTILEDQLTEVARFHRDITHQPFPDKPTLLAGERLQYRLDFLGEELVEFENAAVIADQADALVDLIYVAYGGLLEMGIYPKQAFRVVHAANMKKISGRNKRGDEFEAEKPFGWKPPDWDSLLDVTRDPADRGKYIGLTREEKLARLSLQYGGEPDPDLSLRLNREADPRNAAVYGKKPKILLLGYGRHGKDTVAELLRDRYGLTFTSSSMVCAEKVMLLYFKNKRLEYLTTEGPARGALALPPAYDDDAAACFADRHNHRAEWFRAIEAFNTPDKSMLAQAIFGSHDIYCGLRSAREFHAVRNSGLYDVCIWVDAHMRHPPEGRDSCTVEPWMADYVLDNNGTLEELEFNLSQLMSHLRRAGVC